MIKQEEIDYQLDLIFKHKRYADFFDECLEINRFNNEYFYMGVHPIKISTFITSVVFPAAKIINNFEVEFTCSAQQVIDLVLLTDLKQISNMQAKDIFSSLKNKNENIKDIISKSNITQLNDIPQLESICDQVILDSPKEVLTFKSGKTNIINVLFGKAMKLSNKSANPKVLKEVLEKKLQDKK